jgi:2-keto-4-pentenoate hydratase/2-oxohepta-3-ene-1,7-dioic acid hydratase in catechol pathway
VRIVRVDHAGPRFGILESDHETVSLLQDHPFGVEGAVRSGERVDLSACRVLTPVSPSKVVAVGRNYPDHVSEMGYASPETPSVFLKPPQTLVPDGGTVVLPPRSLTSHVEHEAELAVVIGRPARNVGPDDAWHHIFGFTCANDVSARDLQRSDPQLTRGKGFDTFCPLGLSIETDVAPTQDYDVVCHVNGEERQRGSTAQMLFPIPFLIEWLSSWTTLVPGDVILTGSPAGTSRLEDGDQVSVTVTGISTLNHDVSGGDAPQGP